MTKIVSDLKKCRDPYFCPHGRPTTYEIPLDELLKKFRRK
jgi:DNA mismatch repair protein MutL